MFTINEVHVYNNHITLNDIYYGSSMATSRYHIHYAIFDGNFIYKKKQFKKIQHLEKENLWE